MANVMSADGQTLRLRDGRRLWHSEWGDPAGQACALSPRIAQLPPGYVSRRGVSRGWGFQLVDIAIPIRLWDGDQSNLIPPSHAKYLADNIPTP